MIELDQSQPVDASTNMKVADMFAVIVRTIGLIVLLASGAVLFYAFLNLILGGPMSVVGLLILGVPPFLVGLWMLRGAPPLIAFAFPESRRDSEDVRALDSRI
jgi:hypothetical protein